MHMKRQIFVSYEDILALRLKSELFELRAGYANRVLPFFGSFEAVLLTERQNPVFDGVAAPNNPLIADSAASKRLIKSQSPEGR